MRLRIFASLLLCWWAFCGCTEKEDAGQSVTLFKLLDKDRTNIDFANELEYTESVNTYTFKNFYNGGGVGIADLDNDSLPDIFLSGNLVSNKLYRNKGNLQFEDVTASAGLAAEGSWSTGVSIVDINADGWLDIYVCKSGPPGGDRRNNELFINQGQMTFTEESAAYGLDFMGLSTHAAFFDYDKDGDLDCYLLNNSLRSIGAYDLRKDQRNIPDPEGGNKLLRNDNGKFTDVSKESGIYTSMIGFGLGVTIGDINKDTWPDIYVSNDFFERDYLYLNQKDGSFRESLEEMVREISLGSMGADLADINNDGLPEIFVTEMLPASDDRLKTTTQFENWDKYKTAVEQGYYHQFSRNVLQLNRGNGTFSEIGRLSGVHATDWSWGALILDMDNDGYKDIFVANGIYKDLLDQDYVNFVSNQDMVRKILRSEGKVVKQLIDSIPVNKLPNFAFQNKGDLSFSNQSVTWGLAAATHSNGSAYGDLDNDGDLDLVLNNVNMPAHVYENQSNIVGPRNSYLALSLLGNQKNTYAIGTKVTVHAEDQLFYQELFPMRGFMSSVDYNITFGLGSIQSVDSVIVEWPDDKVTRLSNVTTNQRLRLHQNDATDQRVTRHKTMTSPVFREVSIAGVDYKHEESRFVDFDRERLLFNMISNEGPCLCVGDINNDGLEDFFIGGAKNQAGRLFVQDRKGGFAEVGEFFFEVDKSSEDTDCAFFDADNDGMIDLYVASGSNEHSGISSALLDRLYFNKGNGLFQKSPQLFPAASRFESTGTIEPYDYDKDGDVDLFVGARVIPGLYGVACNGYLLRNDGSGKFTDVSEEIAPGLKGIGMIRDAVWADINNDSFTDLVVVGEWMAIEVFMNARGQAFERSESPFGRSEGWYHTVEVADFNKDGWIDLLVGNHGFNSRFKASAAEPLHLYISDFDQNGTVEHILTRYHDGKSMPLVLRQDLVMQMPSLKKKYLHFESYTGQTITDIFTAAQLKNAIELSAYDMETSLWMNNGDGTFSKNPLPVEAQFSPVHAFFIEDVDEDGNLDILLGGNHYRAKPETGIYDGSYGLFLKGDGQGNFVALNPEKSGISIKGEIRGIKKVSKTNNLLVVSKNDDSLQFFKY